MQSNWTVLQKKTSDLNMKWISQRNCNTLRYNFCFHLVYTCVVDFSIALRRAVLQWYLQTITASRVLVYHYGVLCEHINAIIISGCESITLYPITIDDDCNNSRYLLKAAPASVQSTIQRWPLDVHNANFIRSNLSSFGFHQHCRSSNLRVLFRERVCYTLWLHSQ